MLNEVKSAFRENKLAICISLAILVISLILGYLLEPYAYSYMNPVVEAFSRRVESGAIQLTFADIFLNNLRVIFMMFILGLLFCFSVLILAFNGFFVGYYVALSGNIRVFLYIIPHGIFELSSCILACSSGLILFNFIYRFIKALLYQENKPFSDKVVDSYESSRAKLKQACIIFFISVILMIIAGFIEAYLTIPIARFVISVLG
ncbi:stage II sporulation protein M [Methanobrevibacter sp.]